MEYILTTFFKSQNLENFKSFLKEAGNNIFVISDHQLGIPNNFVTKIGNMAVPDEAFRAVFNFLSSQPEETIEKNEFVLVDWESLIANSSLKKDMESLKEVDDGLFFVESNVKVQDLRMAPFMENLLKICFDLKLVNYKILFEKNPKLLIPRVIKGTGKALLKNCQKFLEVRSKIKSEKFTGVFPIYNCLYANRR